MNRGLQIPNPNQLARYNVNRENQPEGIWQPLYDYQAYPTAGASELQFFLAPIGQVGKTFDDTNMEISGSLPTPISQLVTAIQVVFFPGSLPGAYGAGAGANNWNDVEAIGNSGTLELNIGSKTYLRDGPLKVFPTDFRTAGVAALSDTSTAAADQQGRIDYATFAGRPYEIVPFRLIPNQNFNCKLKWAGGPVATPSGVDARIGVRLLGYQYRLSQ